MLWQFVTGSVTFAGIGSTADLWLVCVLPMALSSWALEFGGHLRTGMEDNIKLDSRTLAPNNAALVRQVAELCAQHDARPATPAEARALLSLPA